MPRRSTTDPPGTRESSGKKRRTEPEPLGRLLTHARDTAARRAGVAIDHETWREVAGDRIAQKSAPGGLEAGVLTLFVASPVWAQELSFLADEICAKLRQRGLRVRSIRFRTGTLPERPALAPARRPQRPVELPDDARAQLERVEDAALREVIALAMGHALANDARRTERAVKPKPGAPGPRSAAPGSARSGRSAPTPSARPRRSREEG